MKKPKFYVGQSVVVNHGKEIGMYAISRASYENDKWIYYAVEGSEVTYLHEDSIIYYYQDGAWQSNSAGSRVAF